MRTSASGEMTSVGKKGTHSCKCHNTCNSPLWLCQRSSTQFQLWEEYSNVQQWTWGQHLRPMVSWTLKGDKGLGTVVFGFEGSVRQEAWAAFHIKLQAFPTALQGAHEPKVCKGSATMCGTLSVCVCFGAEGHSLHQFLLEIYDHKTVKRAVGLGAWNEDPRSVNISTLCAPISTSDLWQNPLDPWELTLVLPAPEPLLRANVCNKMEKLYCQMAAESEFCLSGCGRQFVDRPSPGPWILTPTPGATSLARQETPTCRIRARGHRHPPNPVSPEDRGSRRLPSATLPVWGCSSRCSRWHWGSLCSTGPPLLVQRAWERGGRWGGAGAWLGVRLAACWCAETARLSQKATWLPAARAVYCMKTSVWIWI